MLLDAKSESPMTTIRAFLLLLPRSFVTATAIETGPFKSTPSSNLASPDFMFVSPQLLWLDEKSVSALRPAGGFIAGVTERASGKKVITPFIPEVILWLP